MLRSEPAREFLLSLVREAPGHEARAAIDALAILRDDSMFRERVVDAASSRRDVDLSAAVASFTGATPQRGDERGGRGRGRA
jgi:hypothetical protein